MISGNSSLMWPRQFRKATNQMVDHQLNWFSIYILSPQSINFAPSVNLGRRTSHSPARSLFNDIWAIALYGVIII